jgi:hypothetical protein
MVQIIDNILIIQIMPEDRQKSVIEQIAARYEKQIADNAMLRLELERIKAEQRKMALMFPG